jgi:hypothetical protein
MVAALAVLSLAACGDNDKMSEAKKETTPTPAVTEPQMDAAAPESKEAAPAAPAEAMKEAAPEHAHQASKEAAPAASEPAKAERTPSPAGAKVFFVSPKDGDTIHGAVPVKFGVEGMAIVPAGTDQPNSGHYHLLIDTKLEDPTVPIPADENHKHYGGGQTEAAVGLPPGKHTLQIVLGDKNHVPHDPPVESDVITITVE